MPRLVPRVPRPGLSLLLLLTTGLVAGCGGRAAHDVALDLEGTVSSSTVERVLRDVDLQRAPVTIAVDRLEPMEYGASDQQALEAALRDAVTDMQDARVHVTQEVVEDTSATTQQLTLTLQVEHASQTEYVPVVLDLLRDGRRMLITHVHVMAASR